MKQQRFGSLALLTAPLWATVATAAAATSDSRYPIQQREIIQDSSHHDLQRQLSSSSSSSDSSDDGEGGGWATGGAPPEWNVGETDWMAYEGQLDCNLYRTLQAADGAVQIQEVLDPIHQTVTVDMTFRGYAWLGLALASNGHMVDNVAVIGLPDEPVGPNNPAKYQMTSKHVSGVTPLPAEQQTLQNATVGQNETHTHLRFTQRLQEADGEREIVGAPSANAALYAVGRQNALGMHQHHGAFSIVLTYCLKPDQDPTLIRQGLITSGHHHHHGNRGVWMMHGLLMAVAWGILVPLAIGASVLRSHLQLFLSNQGWLSWFQLHRALNVAALVCISLALLLAVAAAGLDDVFEDGGHPTWGMIVFMLVVLQAVTGFYRPAAAAVSNGVPPNKSSSEQGTFHNNNNNATAEHEEEEPEQAPPPTRTGSYRALWEWQHRLLGFGLVLVAWVTVHTGLELFEDRYGGGRGLAALFWMSAVILTLAIAIVKFQLYDCVLNKKRGNQHNDSSLQKEEDDEINALELKEQSTTMV